MRALRLASSQRSRAGAASLAAALRSAAHRSNPRRIGSASASSTQRRLDLTAAAPSSTAISSASRNAARAASSSAESEATRTSALFASTRKLRDEFWSRSKKAEIAKDADAPLDVAAAQARLRKELEAGETDLQVFLQGVALEPGGGRGSVAVSTPVGPGGGPSVRKVSMLLPTVEDVRELLEARREKKTRVEKPEDLADMLEQFLQEKYLGKRSEHVGTIAAWGPKALGDADAMFAEIAALMDLSLKAFRGALHASKSDFQFEVNRVGDGKECLVMPPSNFSMLGVKDIFLQLLQGYRIVAVVQPQFFSHFREIQDDFAACGLPEGLLEIVPGITPDADPEVLHELLSKVDRLQFTGSSAMFRRLVHKAYELGNLHLEHAGEVSGLNKVRLDGVSASHPAAAAGTAYSAMSNNGELCTSTSIVEFDPATGDTAASVKSSLEAHSFKLGRDPEDASLDVLLKDGKTDNLEVLVEEPATGFQEWWEKRVLAVPRGSEPNVRTNQALGHCVYAPTIERALGIGVREDASCVYCVGVPEDTSAPSARAGTSGCKVPESVFGAMKSYTFAVAGDHDGVGSLQTILSTVKRRGANWRDQEEVHADYELTETAEDLLEFLGPREQKTFPKQISSVLEVFAAFEPEVSPPYAGQRLVNGEGHSQLVTLLATRPSRKRLLIPRGVGLPEDIVKLALLHEMSPLRELPVDLHLLSAQQNGKLRVTDPLKSFLRLVEKRLGWKVHSHSDNAEFISAIDNAEYPPYFFCTKDRHLLPVELLVSISAKGGYLYEGFPTDALSLFRMLTTTQAWTVACTESQVEEATSQLQKMWREVGLRDEPHAAPELVNPPKRRDDDIGGGFGAGSSNIDPGWDDISDDESSDSSDDEADKKEKKATTTKAGETATSKEKPVDGSKVKLESPF